MALISRLMRLAAIGMSLIAALASPVSAYGPAAPRQPVIDGQTISEKDILEFTKGVYGLWSPHSREIQEVSKDPRAMPSDSPLVSYRGREPGPSPRQIIWTSSAAEAKNGKSYYEAYVAALALAVMHDGNAGRTLQAIYARTPRTRAARRALAEAIVRAFTAVSDRKEARAADDAVWIPKHIVPGTTRADAYGMLKSRGLTAYNGAFVKGKAIPAREHPHVGAGCEAGDKSAGAWPYMNEPVPKQDGLCAEMYGTRKAMPNPDAELELDGGFDLGCGHSTDVVITFDRHDRVAMVKVGKRRTSCI
jgi:hypothetical protein